MSGTVSPTLYVVPNGLEAGQPRLARVLLLILPAEVKPGLAAWSGEDWPAQAHTLLDAIAPPEGSGTPAIVELMPAAAAGPALRGSLRSAAKRPLNVEERTRIAGLWKNALTSGGLLPGGMNAVVRTALSDDGEVAPSLFATLPLPMAEAAILLPLQRARHTLDAMSGSDGALQARSALRPPMTVLAANGRPWIGKPHALTLLASAGASVLDPALARALLGPPDVADWLACMARGEPDGSGDLYDRPLDPDVIAEAAVGRGHEDLLWLSDRLHALHHAAFHPIQAAPGSTAPANPAPASQPSDRPDRLFHQLLSSPGLMRLFGWARDAWLVLEEPLAHQSGAWRVQSREILVPSSSGSQDAGPTRVNAPPVAAMLDATRGVFRPTYQPDWPAAGGTGSGQAAPRYARDGLRVLSQPSCPEYVATSLEPVLAAETDRQCGATGRVATRFVTGPLALISPGGGEVLPGSDKADDGLTFARAFDAAPRLHLGIDMADGTVAWHPTSARTIAFTDPWMQGQAQHWPDATLAALAPGWLPQAERDAASVAQMTFQQEPPPANASKGDVAQPPYLCVTDTRVAAYRGEDIGAGANELPSQANQPWPGANAAWQGQHIDLSDEEDLLIGQAITVAPQAGLAPLRFGWRYRFALVPRSFGGAGVNLTDARRLLNDPANKDLCFPHRHQPGFRYLRHEPIATPRMMLAPGVQRTGERQHRLQTDENMVVVRATANKPEAAKSLARTARILLVPSVSLEAVERHDVVRGQTPEPGLIRVMEPGRTTLQNVAVRMPRQGLGSAILEADVTKPVPRSQNPERALPPRFRVRRLGEAAERRRTPYYPDPAAASVVLRLARSGDAGGWLDDLPIVLRVRPPIGDTGLGRWPDVLPVRIELVTVDQSRPQRLVAAGRHEERAAADTSGRFVNGVPPGIIMEAATVFLAPGEEVSLRYWCVPDAADLEAWFDLTESCTALCAAEGRASGASGEAAVTRGLDRLLGRGAIAGDPAAVAASLHAYLMREPLPAIAEAGAIRLVHATDRPSAPPAFVGGRAAVARTATNEAAVLEPFLAKAGAASTWSEGRNAEDDATGIVAGGTIEFDQGTTSSLVVEIEMAAPLSESVDAPDPMLPEQPEALVPRDLPATRLCLADDGTPDHGWPRRNAAGQLRSPCRADAAWPRWLPLITIANIPQPADGRAGLRRLALEEILAGTVDGMVGATVAFHPALESPQARQARLRVRAVSRHAGFIGGTVTPVRNAPPEGLAGPESAPLWVPATARPRAPIARDLTPLFTWSGVRRHRDAGGLVIEGERLCGLRLSLSRPWFSSGEDERLGIVLWPPPAIGLPDGDEAIIPADTEILQHLHDSDLGPLGRFVSVWGMDPLGRQDAERRLTSRFIDRSQLILGDAATFHPRLLLPIPGMVRSEPGAAPTGERVGPRETAAHVSLLATPVRFHNDIHGRSEAIVDFDLRLPTSAPTLFRLGLARLQIRARPDLDGDPDPGRRAGIRLSPPVAIEGHRPPARRYAVRVTRAEARHGAEGPISVVSVVLAGAGGFDAQYRRIRIGLFEQNGADEFYIHDSDGREANRIWTANAPHSMDHQSRLNEDSWVAVFRMAGDILAAPRNLVARIEEDVWLPASDGAVPLALPRFAVTVEIK